MSELETRNNTQHVKTADDARLRFCDRPSQVAKFCGWAALAVLTPRRGRRLDGRNQQFELIVRYTLGNGVHGWLCVSNTFPILPVIGWQYAEPALRILARNYSEAGHWSMEWFGLPL